MADKREAFGDPSDWMHGIPQKVEALAMLGELYEGNIMRAFYQSSDVDVAYIEARAWPEEQAIRPTCLSIVFNDESSYEITWAEGAILGIEHAVSSEADGRDTERRLPYSRWPTTA